MKRLFLFTFLVGSLISFGVFASDRCTQCEESNLIASAQCVDCGCLNCECSSCEACNCDCC